jgi:hypothetical protein
MQELFKQFEKRIDKQVALRIEALPRGAGGYREWETDFFKSVSTAVSDPKAALKWIAQIKIAKGREELSDPKEFALLDARIATAFGKILTGVLKRRVKVEDDKLFSSELRYLGGREIAWMVYQHFKVTDVQGAILGIEDLVNVKLKNDNILEFLDEWDYVFCGLKEEPSATTTEEVFLARVEASSRLKSIVDLYRNDVTQNGKPKSYDNLRDRIDIFIEQERLGRNRSELSRNGPGAGLAGTGPKKKRADKQFNPGKKGICFQERDTGKCSRGADCPYIHAEDAEYSGDEGEGEQGKGFGKRTRSQSPRGRKGKGKDKGKRDRSSSPDKSFSHCPPRGGLKRGTSPSGLANRKTCIHFVRGACKNGNECTFFHPPVCASFKQGSCSDKKCGFLHANAGCKKENTEDGEEETEPSTKDQRKSRPPAQGRMARALFAFVAASLPSSGDSLYSGSAYAGFQSSEIPQYFNESEPFHAKNYTIEGKEVEVDPQELTFSCRSFTSPNHGLKLDYATGKVLEVEPNTEAEKLGIQPGWIIHNIGDSTTSSSGTPFSPTQWVDKWKRLTKPDLFTASREGGEYDDPEHGFVSLSILFRHRPSKISFDRVFLTNAEVHEATPRRRIKEHRNKHNHGQLRGNQAPLYLSDAETIEEHSSDAQELAYEMTRSKDMTDMVLPKTLGFEYRTNSWKGYHKTTEKAEMIPYDELLRVPYMMADYFCGNYAGGKIKSPKFQSPILAQGKKKDGTASREGGGIKGGVQQDRVQLSLPASSDSRQYLVDSGASYHLISAKYLTKAEKKSLRKLPKPMPFGTANGETIGEQSAKVYVQMLQITVDAIVLDNCPPLLSLGTLCKYDGYSFKWPSGEEPYLRKGRGPLIRCSVTNEVPCVFPATEKPPSSAPREGGNEKEVAVNDNPEESD